MKVLHTSAELRSACDAARARGARVGVVPTMGALHAGHLALVREAKARGAEFLVVTIFVNPLQFGEGEDLDRYPRTLEADAAACAELGVDVVFAPDEMYPPGFQTHVALSGLTQGLEGDHRPGHFDGVTTIVTKLFNICCPCLAVFGRKDYQQWRLVERLALDLDIPVEVIAHPIVREADGLALSSRNRYLSESDRARALGIARGLAAAARAWGDGERHPERLASLARQPVEAGFDSVDYVAVVDPITLAVLADAQDDALVVVAAHVGGTRLIDNLWLGRDEPPAPSAI